MLREDVVDAVREGKFHIWAVNTVDEAIALFTGMQPGERREDGTFPEGTFHHAVETRLREFAQLVRQRPGREDEGDDNGQVRKTGPEPEM